MWKLLVLAGIGGFLGTVCRFLVNRLFMFYWKISFPLATFTINVVGCFLFGLLFGLMAKTGNIPAKLYNFLIVGFCGGFTTFSTFSFESFNLSLSGDSLISIFYVISSVTLGILAVWLGLAFTR